MRFLRSSAAAAGAFAAFATAITVDFSSPSAIKGAASDLVYDTVQQYYLGNQTGQIPGIINGYYWWEAGALMGVLIDYWYYTGDSSYNDLATQALQFQASPTEDYMPTNQTQDEGNDDQVFWAFAVMSAAEFNFPNPPSSQPQWLELAQGVFNSQAYRWNTPPSCNGGLNWQIFPWNNGYNYKNAPSNAGFLNLGARLYAYTGNESYADLVNRSWDWMAGIGLISSEYNVFDGTSVLTNCTELDHVQWTYSYGMLIHAAAVMWNKTGDGIWQTRAQGLWTMSEQIFFENKVMLESACQQEGDCDQDQLSFKAWFSRFLAAASKIAPWFYPMVQPYLAASSAAAASVCTGGDNGKSCGFKWTSGYDGNIGLGQQMAAIEVIMTNLIESAGFPVSSGTGGTSKGNASVGGGSDDTSNIAQLKPITTADRAGAGIITALVIVGTLGGAWWLLI